MRFLAVAVLVIFAGCAAPVDDVATPETPAETLPVAEWATVGDAILRPGSPIGWCTFNFLFFEPSNGTYYIGTAGHCTDEEGQRIPLEGHGEIGTVVYDSDVSEGADTNVDFSLILLDEGVNMVANPTMWNTAGPTGIVEGQVELGAELMHHGYALVWGEFDETRDRPGYVSGYSGKDYCAESPVWWGDSGSPILLAEDGGAFGIVSRAGWFNCAPSAQLMGATTEYIMEELLSAGWNVELVTV